MSILLFEISLVPLIHRIDNKGIKVPNLTKPIKSIQHADDLTALITTDRSYNALNDEIYDYSQVSGSKVNNEKKNKKKKKTEILMKGVFESINTNNIKQHIKVLGCVYGNDNLNYENKLEKLNSKIASWKYVKLNLIEKIMAVKTYFIGLVQYQMRAFKMSKIMMRKINYSLFTFIWSSTREKIARKILTQERQNGGFKHDES